MSEHPGRGGGGGAAAGPHPGALLLPQQEPHRPALRLGLGRPASSRCPSEGTVVRLLRLIRS